MERRRRVPGAMVGAMAARAPSRSRSGRSRSGRSRSGRSRSAALAFALLLCFAACGHDTLRLLPVADDAGTDQDDELLDSGVTPEDADVEAGSDVDSGSSFGGRNDGFGGSNSDTSDGTGTSSGPPPGGQGGATSCEEEFCGPCAPEDTDCWRCLYVTSCDFRPLQDECLDRWRAIGCSQCSEEVPCSIPGQRCHLPTNRCAPACETSDDCTVGTARTCESEGEVCLECVGTSDCCPPENEDCGRVCHLGKCFQCSSDGDCGQDEICVQGVCAECVHDGMCPWDEPHCSFGNCQECVDSSHCYPGETCNQEFGVCTGF
jgi:hypothetical protein